MKSRTSPLFILVAFITAIAALYVAKEILLPVAMAILLTFLLTPLADRLERWGVPRIPAVLLVVVISFMAFAGVLGIVGQQLVQLSTEVPRHSHELKEKFKPISKLTEKISHLRDMIAQSTAPAKNEKPPETDGSQRPEEHEKKNHPAD